MLQSIQRDSRTSRQDSSPLASGHSRRHSPRWQRVTMFREGKCHNFLVTEVRTTNWRQAAGQTCLPPSCHTVEKGRVRGVCCSAFWPSTSHSFSGIGPSLWSVFGNLTWLSRTFTGFGIHNSLMSKFHPRIDFQNAAPVFCWRPSWQIRQSLHKIETGFAFYVKNIIVNTSRSEHSETSARPKLPGSRPITCTSVLMAWTQESVPFPSCIRTRKMQLKWIRFASPMWQVWSHPRNQVTLFSCRLRGLQAIQTLP